MNSYGIILTCLIGVMAILCAEYMIAVDGTLSIAEKKGRLIALLACAGILIVFAVIVLILLSHGRQIVF